MGGALRMSKQNTPIETRARIAVSSAETAAHEGKPECGESTLALTLLGGGRIRAGLNVRADVLGLHESSSFLTV